ncbi:MAG: NADH-quinone oxidoreductase subunit L [Chitinophagales bacterium]|nr:NADH-quinone oxidoreductase subunit L [Chitinophagales bacterium]
MNIFPYISLVLIIPLTVFLVTGIFGKRFQQLSGILGTLGLFAAACISYLCAYQYFFETEKINAVYQTIISFKHTWLQFTVANILPLQGGVPEGRGGLSIDFTIMLDPISVMMLVVITTVSLMVHIYSLGYMHGEERYATYFSFLSLFTFSMLGLVLAGNIFQLYMFWELVGVSSFLLIGYYFDKPSAVAAAKKAFIVTRFADLGFLAGILLLSYYAESLDFQTIILRMTTENSSFITSASSPSFIGASAITWALTLIFIGGAGKSAMFPLHIWLPDAMEGPTPVSALIHAATMVVAGVFLVARLFPVFHNVPVTLEIVSYVGIFSAFFAAVIACTQTDIKRVLAYSTMSQIGYMMFALGVSGFKGNEGEGFSASMFHLFTHAMFKALLFLAAGAVIHYVHSNEMKDMGGLRKKMPVTNAVFLIACLAISGVPPLSGFFSKEEILTAAFNHNIIIYIFGLLTACLTAFYMFRLYLSIFWNKTFESHHHAEHKSEAPFSMLFPLIFLAIATIVVGFIPFTHFISPDGTSIETEFHFNLATIAVSAGLLGIAIALFLYTKQNVRAENISRSLGGIYQSAYKKFYVDEVYLFITKDIIFNLISRPAAWIDKNMVDGLMKLIAGVSEMFSEAIKPIQSGKIADYVMWFFAGVILLSVFAVYIFS